MRKRCSICRRWFTPKPRAGARQKVCSETECQRERHRRNCAEGRHKDKLERSSQRAADAVRAPDGTINWEAARDVVGPEVAGVLQEVTDPGRLRDLVLKVFNLEPHISPIVGLRDAVLGKSKEQAPFPGDLPVANRGDPLAHPRGAAIGPNHAGRPQPSQPPLHGSPSP
jgi:hypothetical protein